MRHRFWLPVVLIALLLGCTPTNYESEEATVTNEPEAVVRRLTATPVPPTSTAEPSPATIAVMQETSTEAVRNVLAREDDGTLRPTITRRPPTITPTPKLTDEDISATVIAIQQPREYDSYLSPDGRKQIEILSYDCTEISLDKRDEDKPQFSVEQFNLVDLSDGSKVLIDEQLDFCAMPGGGFQGLFWSEDGRFFYYTDARDGAAHGCAYGWTPPFFRFDVVSGDAVRLGSGDLSHDRTTLATREDREIVVWDVNTAAEIARFPAFDEEKDDVGYIAWSPDGRELVYTMMDAYCAGTHELRPIVVRVNLDSETQSVVLETASGDDPFLTRVEWNEPTKLTLSHGGDSRERVWTYDLEAESLTENIPDHHTVFDRVMGRPVSTIELSDTVCYRTLVAYTFESVEIAAAMANAIQPNGTVIHYFAPDGTNRRETIEPELGRRPYWWHVGDTIYLHLATQNDGGCNTLETISRQLDAPILNADIEREMISFRIANGRGVPIETVTLDLGGGEAVYTDMFVGKKTSYQSVGDAADSGTMLVGINGDVQAVTIEGEGEGEMLAAGNYTLVLSVRNNGTIDHRLVVDGYAY